MFLADQLLLVLSACALGAAALRSASAILDLGRARAAGTSVIEHVIVAAVLAAAFVVCWTLLVGLPGMAGSPVALAAGPIAVWLAIRMLSVGRGSSLLGELAARWLHAPARTRLIGAALCGLFAGCVIEIARQPGFDVDAVAYHLADIVGWLHSGHAGAVQQFSYDFPVGYYPVTGEVLLTWVLGISHSFAPLALWSPAIYTLGLLALWRLLVVMHVPRPAAVAATCAFGTLPILVIGLNLNGPGTDLPAVTWLACTAALSFAAGDRPVLLSPALLAAGLAIGTKTTVAPLAVIALAVGAWRARTALAGIRGWLAGGAITGLLVSAPWYVRNTLSHGWPLWPFSSGPTGDPLPHAMHLFHASFLSRPVATVRAIGSSNYFTWLAGGLGLIAATLIAPLVVRTRAVLLACIVSVAALLIWGAAPFTGVARNPLLHLLTLSTLRYMLAALGACAVALALAARDGVGPARMLFTGLLALFAIGSVVSDARLRFPDVPTPKYLLAGAVLGAVAGALASPSLLAAVSAQMPTRAHESLRAVAGGVTAALAIAFLALSAPNWLWRERQRGTYNAPVLSFMLTRPGFASGSQPIAFAPSVLATLAGPHLRHPISLIGAQEPCASVRSRLRSGWVVVFPRVFAAGITTPFDAPSCLSRQQPIYNDGYAVVYGPAS